MHALADIGSLRPDGSIPGRDVRRYEEGKQGRFLAPEKTEHSGEVLHQTEREVPRRARCIPPAAHRLRKILLLYREHRKDDCFELRGPRTKATLEHRSFLNYCFYWADFPYFHFRHQMITGFDSVPVGGDPERRRISG